MLFDLGRNYLHKGYYFQANNVADLMLKYHPKNVNAMLLKGNIYYKKLHEQLAVLKARSIQITPFVKQRLDHLYKQNLLWYSKAETLGWREPPDDFEEKYLQSIEKFKLQRM